MNRFASFRPAIAGRRLTGPSIDRPSTGRSSVGKSLGALALLAAVALGGCSTSVEDIGSTAVDPAKFTFYKCPDLIVYNRGMLNREQELRKLMEKAEAGTGGQFVSAIAYQSEYLSVRGDLNLIQKVAAEKNCDIPKRNSDRAIH
jgi:hypothetical protein